MKTFTILAGASLLAFGGAAYAQDVPTDAGALPQGPEATQPADELPAANDDWSAQDSATADTATTDGAVDDTTTSPDASTAPAPAVTADAAPATGAQSFTDDQISSFAAAALQIQSLPGDAATKQEQAATIVADSGLDAETFNAIGQAMQSDPAVAQRVQLAASSIQGEPEG